MTLFLQNPLSNSTYRIKFHIPNNTTHFNPTTARPKLYFSPNLSNPPSFQTLNNNATRFNLHIKAYNSSTLSFPDHERPSNFINLDAFLSVLESLCVVSSVVVSLGCAVNWFFLKHQNPGLVVLGNRVLVWLLAGAVAVGSVIRRRQWSRVCGFNSRPGLESGNLIERLEKLEESMRSATTIIRMLSRQLEKLGIRFRVTRKALKDPISETAALAQKNSEATRALAMQEGILEKELAEVQKVLLAMQDQQQKQLELILAIAKSGKLFETKPAPSQGRGMHETGSADGGKPTEAKLPPRQLDGQQMEVVVAQKGAANDNSLGS